MTVKLRKYINNNFFQSDKIIEICEKYELIGTIENIQIAISKKIDKQEYKLLSQNAGLFLNTINPKLSNIKDEGDKRIIESLLVELVQPYLHEIFKNDDSGEIYKELKNSLELACELNGYKKDHLFATLNIEKYGLLKPKNNTIRYYYTWNLKMFELDELSRVLKGNRILISSRNDFLSLFDNELDVKKIVFDTNSLNLILIIFLILYERGIITPRKTNGKFAPLNMHAMDIDGLKLYKVPPNKKLDRIKRNSNNYNKTRQKAVALINSSGIKRVVEGTLTNDP